MAWTRAARPGLRDDEDIGSEEAAKAATAAPPACSVQWYIYSRNIE